MSLRKTFLQQKTVALILALFLSVTPAFSSIVLAVDYPTREVPQQREAPSQRTAASIQEGSLVDISLGSNSEASSLDESQSEELIQISLGSQTESSTLAERQEPAQREEPTTQREEPIQRESPIEESPSSTPTPTPTSQPFFSPSPNPTPGVEGTGFGESGESGVSESSGESGISDPLNSQTGADSENSATLDVNEDETLNQTNSAIVQNNFLVDITTGGNSASKNTGDASVETGDADLTINLENNINNNLGLLGGLPYSSGSLSSNQETGAGSTNEATLDENYNQEVSQQNFLLLNNSLNIDLSTGDNKTEKNTGNGEIQTGDADLAVNIVNLGNSNITGISLWQALLDILGTYVGDLNLSSLFPGATAPESVTTISSNQETGADSQNLSQTTKTYTTDINQENVGSIQNNLNLNVETGSNSAEKNTGNGSIKTGDANVIANIINFLNSNIVADNYFLGAINVLGEFLGNLILPAVESSNSQTGANSQNSAVSLVSSNISIENQNQAEVGNNILLNGQTGDNSVDKNTLNGQVESGDVSVQGNVATVANQNVVAGSSWGGLLINVFGLWESEEYGTIQGSPENPVVLLLTFGEASNNKTGADSENTAVSETDYNLTILNSNQGTIANNVKINASTGDNSASENTGNGSIETGDVNILTNAVNFLNNNFVVGDWFFGVVNVLGSWVGNILGGNTVSNEKTGAGSENYAYTGSNYSVDIKNQNQANVVNNVLIDVDTGSNKADKNTLGGEIKTGDVEIVVGLEQRVNSNLTLLGWGLVDFPKPPEEPEPTPSPEPEKPSREEDGEGGEGLPGEPIGPGDEPHCHEPETPKEPPKPFEKGPIAPKVVLAAATQKPTEIIAETLGEVVSSLPITGAEIQVYLFSLFSILTGMGIRWYLNKPRERKIEKF